jgi:hypothetical protein
LPHFYFDVFLGDRFNPDEVGSECETLNAAEVAATRTASELAHDCMPSGRASEVVVQVRDEPGHQVFAVAVSMKVRRMELAPA